METIVNLFYWECEDIVKISYKEDGNDGRPVLQGTTTNLFYWECKDILKMMENLFYWECKVAKGAVAEVQARCGGVKGAIK